MGPSHHRLASRAAIIVAATLTLAILSRADAHAASLSSSSTPLHLRGDKTETGSRKCANAGKVGHGLKCGKQNAGLECQQHTVSCADLWNEETEKCYDLRVSCTCDGSTWSCPQVRCLPPDDRCTKKKPQSKCDRLQQPVGQGLECGRTRLQCPWKSNPVTCGGGYNEQTGKCEAGTVVEPSCACSRETKTWNCVLPKCPLAAPDARCPSDCAKFNVAPGEFCFGEGGSCPYHEFTCKGAFDEASGTCEDVTIRGFCECHEGQFVCAVPDCAPPDERCGLNGGTIGEEEESGRLAPVCWNEKVASGAACSSPGMQCPDYDNAMVCKGQWNDNSKSCYDQVVTAPCTCDPTTTTWMCGFHIMGCRNPDPRCACPSPETISPGGTCEQPGADCPFSQGTTTCHGQWSEEKQACYDSTIETSCHCHEGAWICAMASCAPPDERCLPKVEELCPYKDADAPIGHGLTCSSEGMECADYNNEVTCTGVFVPEKQTCYDKSVVPQCKCKEGKWDCQEPEKCPLFDPNCLNSCFYAGQGIQCSKPGLECPSSSSTVTCTGQWNDVTQSCHDITMSPPCFCDGESWNCAAVKCAPPDSRCVETTCPSTEEVGPGLTCSLNGKSCPWMPYSCGGPTWNEETQSCQSTSFMLSCFCSEGVWMCAMPMCAMPIPDARCSCEGHSVEPGEFCFGEGATCLHSVMCTGMLQEDGRCLDAPVTNKCTCSEGTWDCDLQSSCPAPSETCA